MTGLPEQASRLEHPPGEDGRVDSGIEAEDAGRVDEPVQRDEVDVADDVVDFVDVENWRGRGGKGLVGGVEEVKVDG